MRYILYILLIFILFTSSCMDDDSIYNFNKLNITDKDNGVFILNEGNFMYNNSSLSYYKPDSNIVINNVFYNTNALPLGDIAQSIEIKDSLAYIVINNSGKIYIININNFKYVGKITGFTSPRDIIFINDYKAYVSDMYSKKIYIIDLQQNIISGEINISNNNSQFTQHSSENFVKYNNLIFTNSWSYDNKILVIDLTNDSIIDSISVGKQPNSMVLDKNNKLWVLSDGGFSGSSYGQENASLSKINTQNFNIEKVYTFNDINISPFDLCTNANKDSLFFIYGNWASNNIANSGVYSMNINDNNLPNSPLISCKNNSFYSLNINKSSNEIYIGNALNFNQAGNIYRFSSSGIVLDTFKVGINPGSFCFKN